MTKIGVMSDSHGIVPKQIYTFFKDVDIILHAGDLGNQEVLKELRSFKKTVAVYGNCDSKYMDNEVKSLLKIQIEQVKILMTHIGGYPKHYQTNLIPFFKEEKPQIFICGHSHILKVLYDKEFNFLLINPGACGRQGFHQVSTLIRFVIDNNNIKDLDVLDFDKF
ncbi:MAG: metallophosphoesterase family protein [Bacteroidales bacterium]